MLAWTREQEEAVYARNSNLLVSASAGSGKTAVLTERIMQLIVQDKVDLDKMLVVTFTNAAAGEMRERISAALLAELEKGNGSEEREEHLRKQINLLSRASISTIHSFCMEVARRYFHVIDLEPDFRVADAGEADLIKMEAAEELLEEEYEKSSRLFLELVEMFGGSKYDTPLQDMILHVYEFIQRQPYPLQWLKEKVQDFAVNADEFEKSPWAEAVLRQVKMQLRAGRELFEEALSLSRRTEGLQGYRNVLVNDLLLVDNTLQAAEKGIRSLYCETDKVKFKNLPKAGKDADTRLKEQVKDFRDKGKDAVRKALEVMQARSPVDYCADLNELYPYMEYLYQLVADFSHKYREKKREKGLVDFDDLEHLALEILADEDIAREYRRQYEYIFVDEYQDSNLVQETVLNFIKREDNLFLVGDVKQSIYRFRLADPTLFIEKYENFEPGEGARNRRIDLRVNFRSREGIIDAVNYVFSCIMSRDFGEIDYDEKARLFPAPERKNKDLQDREERVELCLIDKNGEAGETEEAVEEIGDIEMEARFVARRIKELIGQRFYDSELKCYRDIEYRDIVVLLRVTKEWAAIFADCFVSEGIPVYADAAAGYFETLEIEVFMNLLRLIDNKRQDIPLLSVMRSPICNFSIDDLIEIRVNSEAADYFAAVGEYIRDFTNDLSRRLRDFIQRLEVWKDESRFMRMDDFIWKLLTDTGYYYYVGAMPGGQQRQANLRLLYERAGQFQRTSMKGLFNFIKFVDKIKSGSRDVETARILGENDNVVRVMSVHKSKGLEFPVVILAGMGKQFNLSETSPALLLHNSLGMGPRYVNPELRIYRDTIARTAIKNQAQVESLAEEMRILYVALTRAKEKLVLVGSVKKLAAAAEKWSRPLKAYNLVRGKNFLDWLGPVLIRHPDGEKLREVAGVDWKQEQLLPDSSKWDIKILPRFSITQGSLEQRKTAGETRDFLKNFKPCNRSGLQDLINARLNWKYSYREAGRIPSKLSVTQITKLKIKDLESIKITASDLVTAPKFISEELPLERTGGLTGAEKGNIVHSVMRHLDFRQVKNEDDIGSQVAEMACKGIIREEEMAAVEYSKIAAFFRSKLGKRVLKAEKLYREVPFNFLCKASRLIEGIKKGSEDEALLVQGVIDLYFLEDEELVLVDYKTDFISRENRDMVIDKYRVQLELYKEALESIQGKKVKESYLFLFDSGEEILL